MMMKMISIGQVMCRIRQPLLFRNTSYWRIIRTNVVMEMVQLRIAPDVLWLVRCLCA